MERRSEKIVKEIEKKISNNEKLQNAPEEGEDFSFSHLLSEYKFTPIPINEKFILDPILFPVPQSTSPVGQIPPSNMICNTISKELKERQKKFNLEGQIWPVVHIIRV